MLITRTSIFDGVSRTLDLPVTERQLADWQNGKLIQDVMPHLSADEREFIMTGMTPEQFEALNDEHEGDDEGTDLNPLDEDEDEDDLDGEDDDEDLEEDDDLEDPIEDEDDFGDEPPEAPDESEAISDDDL